MNRYIELFLEELNDKTKIAKGKQELEFKRAAARGIESHFEDVENYLYGEEISIATTTDVMVEQLPPGDKLSQKQKELLSIALKKLLECHWFELDFPQSYPEHLCYPFIRQFWQSKKIQLTGGTMHIEFCDYEQENCPFQGYCDTCKDFDNVY